MTKKKDKLVIKSEEIADDLTNEKGEIELHDKEGNLKPGLGKWEDLLCKTGIKRGGNN